MLVDDITSNNVNRRLTSSKKKRSRSNRKTRNYINKDDYLKNIDQGPIIIIDCDYDDKLLDKNIKSLIVQLSLSYSCIRKSKIPLKMIICGISKRLKEGLLKTLANKWLGVELSDENIKEILNKYSNKEFEYNITYLTADSDNILGFNNEYTDNMNNKGFSNKEILIIGGIIDRNKYKNMSKIRAENLNIKTAKLPIKESGIVLNTNQVLTINNVVECIVKYNETLNWYDTFDSVLPKRKREF